MSERRSIIWPFMKRTWLHGRVVQEDGKGGFWYYEDKLLQESTPTQSIAYGMDLGLVGAEKRVVFPAGLNCLMDWWWAQTLDYGDAAEEFGRMFWREQFDAQVFERYWNQGGRYLLKPVQTNWTVVQELELWALHKRITMNRIYEVPGYDLMMMLRSWRIKIWDRERIEKNRSKRKKPSVFGMINAAAQLGKKNELATQH